MIKLLYVTTRDAAQAQAIGRTLVEDGLAACANILPAMQSIYRWDGKVEEAAEAVLILKTTEGLAAAATARVVELHSYELPCVLELAVAGGHPAYLAWLAAGQP